MKPDADLQQHVMHALAADDHVDETAIGVSVRHGVVALNGTVGSYAEKAAAEAAVHRISGVLDVANELEIKASWHSRPTDSEIAEAVRNALAADPLVPAAEIQSTVGARGHVTLLGTVKTLCEHDHAEVAVRDLDGVELVTNMIEVDSPPISLADLRATIDRAVEDHVHHELARTRIDIELQGSTVVLTGTIGSFAERQAVLGAVKNTTGVTRVDDRLRDATELDAGHAVP